MPAKPIAGASAGSSGATGALEADAATQLAGASAGSSTATGGLDGDAAVQVAGAAAGTSTATGAMAVKAGVHLFGAPAGTSTATGDLDVAAGVHLFGGSDGGSDATGDLTVLFNDPLEFPPWLQLRGTWNYGYNPDAPSPPEVCFTARVLDDEFMALAVQDTGSADGTMTVETQWGTSVAFRCVDANDFMYFDYADQTLVHYHHDEDDIPVWDYIYPIADAGDFPPFDTDRATIVVKLLGTQVELRVNDNLVYLGNLDINVSAPLHGVAMQWAEEIGDTAPASAYRSFAFDTDPPDITNDNDDYLNATAIDGETGSVTTPAQMLSTFEDGELDFSSMTNSWWYRWTAPDPLPAGLSVVVFKGRYFDYPDEYFILAAYTVAASLAAAELIAYNEMGWTDHDNPDFEPSGASDLPRIAFPVEPGATYAIQVAGQEEFNVATSRFEWEMVARADNDEPTTATAITDITGSAGPFSTVGATFPFYVEPSTSDADDDNRYYEITLNGTVWFAWTCPLDWDPTKFVRFTVDGPLTDSDEGVTIGVYTGTDYLDLVAVDGGGLGFDDSYWVGMPYSVGIEVDPGVTYLVMVGTNAGPRDDLTLTWDDTGVPTPPVNDPVSSFFYPDRLQRLTYATTEVDEPLPPGATRSVWYQYNVTPGVYPDPSDFIFEVFDGPGGLDIQVFEINGPTYPVTMDELGPVIASGVDTVTFPAHPYVYPATPFIYWIQVSDGGDLTDHTTFNVSFRVDGSAFDPPANDEPAGAIVLPHVPDPTDAGFGVMCATLLGATLSVGFDNPTSEVQDVWFTWVSPITGSVTLSYDGNFVELAAFLDGDLVATASYLVGPASLIFDATAGVEYLIRAAAPNDSYRDREFCVTYPNPVIPTVGGWKIHNYDDPAWVLPGGGSADLDEGEVLVDFGATGWRVFVDPPDPPWSITSASAYASPGAINYAWPPDGWEYQYSEVAGDDNDPAMSRWADVTGPVGSSAVTYPGDWPDPPEETTRDSGTWLMWLAREITAEIGYRYEYNLRVAGSIYGRVWAGDEALGATDTQDFDQGFDYPNPEPGYFGYSGLETGWLPIPDRLLTFGVAQRITARGRLWTPDGYLDLSIRRVTVEDKPRLKVWDYVNEQWWGAGDSPAPGRWIQAPNRVIEATDPTAVLRGSPWSGAIDLYRSASWTVQDAGASECAFGLGRQFNELGNWFGYNGSCPTSNAGPWASAGSATWVGSYRDWTPGFFSADDLRWRHIARSWVFLDATNLYSNGLIDWHDHLPTPVPPDGVDPLLPVEWERDLYWQVRSDIVSYEFDIIGPTFWGAQTTADDDLLYYLHPYREEAAFGVVRDTGGVSQQIGFKNGNPAYGNDAGAAGDGGMLICTFTKTDTDTRHVRMTRNGDGITHLRVTKGLSVEIETDLGYDALKWPWHWTEAEGVSYPYPVNHYVGGGRATTEWGAAYTFSVTSITRRTQDDIWDPLATGQPDRDYRASGTGLAGGTVMVRPPRYRYRFPSRPLKGWDYVNGIWSKIADMQPIADD